MYQGTPDEQRTARTGRTNNGVKIYGFRPRDTVTPFIIKSNRPLTRVPDLSFDALAVGMSYHHRRELYPNSSLSVGPEAWHSAISPWAFILHYKCC